MQRQRIEQALDRMGALLISQVRTRHCKYLRKFWHFIHKR